MEWCVLTDGQEWRFYNSTAAVDAEEKLFRRVRICQDNLDETAATLSLLARDNIEGNLLEPLWTAYFVDRKVKQALRQMLDSCDMGLIRLVRRKAPRLKPKQVIESLGRLEVRIDSLSVRAPAGTAAPSTPGSGSTPAPPAGKARQHRGRPGRGVSLADLIGADLLKAPARLFRQYKGHVLEVVLLASGELEFQEQRYPSPSAAAKAACTTVTRKKTGPNGWDFWQVQAEEGKPRTLGEVRDAYLKRQSAGRRPADG